MHDGGKKAESEEKKNFDVFIKNEQININLKRKTYDIPV